jgi:hypothetical protein
MFMKVNVRLIRLVILSGAFIAFKDSSALAQTTDELKRIIILQQAQIESLQSDRDKIRQDLILLWSKMDDHSSRVEAFRKKLNISEDELKQSPVANTQILCRICAKDQ